VTPAGLAQDWLVRRARAATGLGHEASRSWRSRQMQGGLTPNPARRGSDGMVVESGGDRLTSSEEAAKPRNFLLFGEIAKDLLPRDLRHRRHDSRSAPTCLRRFVSARGLSSRNRLMKGEKRFVVGGGVEGRSRFSLRSRRIYTPSRSGGSRNQRRLEPGPPSM